MPEVQITARFYPTLSTVISTEELPDLLGFLKEGLAGLLDSIYFKDLQYSKSVYGDKAFYSLRVVSRDRLDLEIPGTGIFLSLNPDASDTVISSFPITVEYEWPILAYLRSFDLNGFSFLPEVFFNLALQVLKISEAPPSWRERQAHAPQIWKVFDFRNYRTMASYVNDSIPINFPA